MKTCEICAKQGECNRTTGIMFGFCSTEFKPDADKIYKRLDSLEGCEDNEVYTAEVKELRSML